MARTKRKRTSQNVPPRMRISAFHVRSSSSSSSSSPLSSHSMINVDVATCNRQRINSYAMKNATGHLSKCVLNDRGDDTIWVPTEKKIIGLLWNGINEDSKRLRDREQIAVRTPRNPTCNPDNNGTYAALSNEFLPNNSGANYTMMRCTTDITRNAVNHVWVNDDIVVGGVLRE